MRKKLGNPSTTKVFSTDDDGIRQECDTKETVEAACIRENESRFSQTEDTPAMMSPLLEELGYLADTDAAEEILAGTFEVPEGTCKYAKKLIAELEMPESVRKGGLIDDFVSTQDHISGWKKQKESISSDPEGLTFSHYKAGIEEESIAQFDATLRSLPYQYGFVPEAWIPDLEKSWSV
jgi:hypothetical protein